MNEQVLDRNYQKGSSGDYVRLIQEWLCLHNINVILDGSFGPATEAAVKKFQSQKRLTVDGVVGWDTFTALIGPRTNALQELPARQSLGEMVVAYARQHLQEKPREIGGQNMGPWVRLYMNGHQGVEWQWCAGFVSFILKQACHTMGVPVPIQTSFASKDMAASAKQMGMFLPEVQAGERSRIKPGAIFLCNTKTPGFWSHTGIVTKADAETFQTIEGNSNDEGSAEGYEVCRLTRGYERRDFILI